MRLIVSEARLLQPLDYIGTNYIIIRTSTSEKVVKGVELEPGSKTVFSSIFHVNSHLVSHECTVVDQAMNKHKNYFLRSPTCDDIWHVSEEEQEEVLV